MNRTLAPVALLAATVLLAVPLRAQTRDIEVPPLPQFGGFAGISLPVGGISSSQQAGFNLGALAQYRAPGEALGIRGELGYEHFSHKKDATVGNASATTLTLNALYFVQGYDFRPYIIGGMGFYHLNNGWGNHPGLNAGMGIDIPLTGMAAHLEARIHWALTDHPSYVSVPLSFGIRF